MLTIKPSEGRRYARQSVFIEGLIAGQKSHSSQFGGRWVVDVSDGDGSPSRIDGTLVLNERPTENPAIAALGVTTPNRALLALFSGDEFAKLFQPGRRFRAEVVIGVHDANIWFNVSQLLLFEPSFSIGTRQVFREPFCERRLLLRARGIKGNTRTRLTRLGGVFIGNLVHSTFQDFACSINRAQVVADFSHNPKEFLLRSIQPDVLLLGAFGQLGDTPCISGDEWTTAKNQVLALINSAKVMELLESESQWCSEVPVGTDAIHGDIDLRTESKILELKTGQHKPSHDNQLYMYLIGEMLQQGYSIAGSREAMLVSSSTRISDDSLRITHVGESPQLRQTLERFLLARHRLLLVSSGLRLPKIEFEPQTCVAEKCEYYLAYGDEGYSLGTSACHFYCQTDRHWQCTGCRHSSWCTEHSKYHPFQVLDEANKIRLALAAEIEQRRRETDVVVNWELRFQALECTGNREIALRLEANPIIDPPFPGERVLLRVDGREFATWGQLSSINDLGEWVVVNRGVELPASSVVQLANSRSTLKGVYHLLSCLDELQRLADTSDRDGIAFAGGNVPSKQPEFVPSLDCAIKDASVTDIFCQSFSIKTSKELFEHALRTIQGRALVVSNSTHVPTIPCVDLRGSQLLRIASESKSISEALSNIKDELEAVQCWLMSPDQLLDSEVLAALPRQGNKFFNFAVIFEESGITGLEYFCIRKYAQRMVTIGDANCVGRPIRSSQCQMIGLGDNLLARVYERGFPLVENKLSARLVCPDGQELHESLYQGLKACRLHTIDSHNASKEFEFVGCDSSQPKQIDQLVLAREMADIPGNQPKLLRLRVEDVSVELEMHADVDSLSPQFNGTLVKGDALTAPISGRVFTVASTPTNRTDGGLDWLVEVLAPATRETSNDVEAAVAAEKIRELLSVGVKPKNLAVMSPFRKQLESISSLLESSIGRDIAYRTPHGVRAETWGHVIISCGAQSAQAINARELYTMMRSAITRVYVIGSEDLFDNHPLLRNMDVPVRNWNDL